MIPRTGPLYRVVAYDAVCFNGTEGFYFVAITQLCIVVFAMIMVTLRFAFKPAIVVDQAIERQSVIAAPGEGGNDDTNVDAAMPMLCDTQEALSPTIKQEVTIEEHSTTATPGNGSNDGTNDDTVMQNTEKVVPKIHDGPEELNPTVLQDDIRRE